MKNVKIHEIEFEKSDDSFKSKNYPSSGLFIVNDKENVLEDVRFVNKIHEYTTGIAPLDMFLMVCELKQTEKQSEEILISESKQKYDPDFILEFSRILLNRK